MFTGKITKITKFSRNVLDDFAKHELVTQRGSLIQGTGFCRGLMAIRLTSRGSVKAAFFSQLGLI